ncbi:MAG TPA: hypothetical protein VNQ76_07190 [Planctomicrobium sp.]|nr:hypothetical protein [Planctomicrobium sp.]
MNRRDFHQMALVAFGGVMAGSLAGCPPTPQESGSTTSPPTTPAPVGQEEEVSLLLTEPHVCRGLNTCKNLGASKENECAGQGTCATVAAHACGSQNECKGQGGCGANPGENSCKGKGLCHVPLEHAWESGRKNFEAAMTDAGKKFGAAPAKK